MKGSSTLYAAIPLLMVALIANVSQVKALSPEQTCPLVKNNTYIADPSDCQKWVLCISGKAFYGKCQEGYLYDAENGWCDFPSNVNCNSNIEDMCLGLTDIYKSDPSDCNKFCYCHEGVTYCEKCPTGQHFDPITVSCVWASESNCEINSPCRLVQNGFMGSTKSCRSWIRCGNSQVVSQGDCDVNRAYNPNTQECDYPQNVKCSTSPPGPPAQVDPTPPAGLCKKALYFYSDGQSCNGYFHCAAVNAVGQWGKCPINSNFSEDLQKCVDPDKVICDKDRCNGITKAFMAKGKTNCKKYLNCKNGAAYAEGTCPVNAAYFNEIAGVCQPKQPDYPICSS